MVTCPVSNLERSMKLTGVSTFKVSDFLFKPIAKVRSRYKVIDKVKPLSYTRARESLVGLLLEFVPNTANISLHSFRSGGATTAANDSGTLRSNDADGDENVKKTIGFINKTTALHVHHTFFVHFFPVFAQLRRENA